MAADGDIQGGAGALALGLVHSKTSGHGCFALLPTASALLAPPADAIGIFEIDRFMQRARRMRKSVITGARLHVNEAAASGFRGSWVMLTTTYADDADAQPYDVSALLKRMRRWFDRACARRYGRGGPVFRYEWVLELTRRLRPHYHLLFWLPTGIWFPKPDNVGWWTKGSTRIEAAKNAVGYIAKYASKFVDACAAALPKGLRTHGVGGLNPESKREMRWWKSPTEAREALGESADIRKTNGGYFDKRTGEFWPSPWHVFFTPDGRIFAWRNPA